MPVVPFSQNPSAPALGPSLPADDWLMMAAAQMHGEGRLLEPLSSLSDEEKDAWVEMQPRRGRTNEQLQKDGPPNTEMFEGKDDAIWYMQKRKPKSDPKDLTS